MAHLNNLNLKNITMQTRILNSIKYIISHGLIVLLLLLCLQCKTEDPEKIIADFKSTLALVKQYDYGKTHAWLDEFQKTMTKIYNNPQIYAEIESLMIEALKTEALPAAKQMICTYLGPIASGKAVPVLEGMVMDRQLSASALSVLQQIPDQAADEALLKELSAAEGLIKQGIINVLAVRKSPNAVNPLSELIFDANFPVGRSAVFALGKIGTDEACTSLEKAFQSSEGPLKWEIADALIVCADNMIPERINDALPIYNKIYESKAPPSIFFAALRGIIKCDPENGITLLSQLLVSEDPEMQTLIIPVIRDIDWESDLSEFLKIMPQLGEYQQMQLFTVMADRQDLSVKDLVKQAVTNENPDIRLAALMALRNIASASDVEFLATVASNSRGRERDMARECLAIIKGDEVDNEIIKGLQNPDPKIRLECVRGIGERNLKTGVDPVLGTLEDKDRKVRLESYQVLGKLADPDKLKDIIDVSLGATSSAERNEAERTITLIALKIQNENDRAADILAVLPDVEDDASLVMLIQAMGDIGSKTALPIIQDYLNHENSDVQIAAIKALSVWPDSTPLDELLHVLESSEDVKAHNLALRGYIRMVQIDNEMTEDQKFEACKYAYDLTASLDEKKIVVSGLSEIKSKGAFQMAVGLLNDQELQSEAKAAISSMAGSLGGVHPEYTRTELRKLISTTEDPEFKARLEEILKWMD